MIMNKIMELKVYDVVLWCLCVIVHKSLFMLTTLNLVTRKTDVIRH